MVEEQELSIDGSGSGDVDDIKIHCTDGTTAPAGAPTDGTACTEDGVNAQSTLLRCEAGDDSAGLLGRKSSVRKSGTCVMLLFVRILYNSVVHV